MAITLKEAIDDCWSRSKCADGQDAKYYHAWKVLYSFLEKGTNKSE